MITGTLRWRSSVLTRSSSAKPDAFGQLEVEHDAVEARRVEPLERLLAGRRRSRPRRPRRRSARRCCAARRRRRRPRARCASRWPPSCDGRVQRVGERLGAGVARRGSRRRRAASRSWRRSSSASASTGRCRVRGSRLRRSSVSGSSPAAQAEHDHVRPVLLRERERGHRAHRHEALEAALARGREQRGRAVDVAVDDQRDAVALRDLLAVVGDRGRLGGARRRRAAARRRSSARRAARPRAPARSPAAASAGSSSVNVEPSPSVLVTRISPPSRRAISRLIDRPEARCRRSGGWSSRRPAGRPRRSAAACPAGCRCRCR